MCLKFNTNQLVNFDLFTPQLVRTEEIVEFLLLFLGTYIYFLL